MVTLFDQQNFVIKLRSPCVEMNTPTMNVCLSVLDSKDKRNSHFFQLKDVPGFLV